MKFIVSIRRTLLIRCGLGVGFLAVLLSLSIYFFVRQGLYEELDESIRETASILANQMEYEHGEIIFEWQEGLGTNTDISDQVLFQYWNEKSGLTTRSPALTDTDLPKFSGPSGNPDIETVVVGRLEQARALGMVIYPYLNPAEVSETPLPWKKFDPKDFPHTLVVARNLTPVLRTLSILAATLAIGTLLTFMLGYIIIRRAVDSSLQPIAKLTQQVHAHSAERLDSAMILPSALPAELVPLAESFDSLLSRLASVRDREKDFIRHASHELRTPIASLSATTELALSRDRDASEYRRHLESCARTAADLGELVNRLSGLARIGGPTPSANLEPLRLAEILHTSIQTFAPRLESRSLKTALDIPDPEIPALADPVLTSLIINNLLDNAIAYSPENSTIAIRLSRNVDLVELSFTNLTSDLPENLDRLFEPLFRRETSRAESPHLGIGLTLSRDAALAMHATLTADRPDQETIRFTLSLPSP